MKLGYTLLFMIALGCGGSGGSTEMMYPTPYTADQIRAATQPGRTYRFKVEAGGETKENVIVFESVDAEGAVFGGKRVTWDELRKHAEFPANAVTKREETITVPAGTFDCWVYVVKKGDETSTFYFAKSLPGAPVLFFTEKNGTKVMTSTLVEHKVASAPTLASASASASPPPPPPPPASASVAAAAPAPAPVPPKTGPVTTTEDAVARAAVAANAALDKSYSQNPPRKSPWVQESNAHVEGDAKKGWTIKWSSFPPAGFSHEATVTVSPKGEIKVTKAKGSFSPD